MKDRDSSDTESENAMLIKPLEKELIPWNVTTVETLY